MSAIAPEAARALAVRLLEAQGLVVTARNARGDSLYLADGAAALTIRVSSHARTAKQRLKHANVATSLVIREPKTPAQVAAMVETALRTYRLALSLSVTAP